MLALKRLNLHPLIFWSTKMAYSTISSGSKSFAFFILKNVSEQGDFPPCNYVSSFLQSHQGFCFSCFNLLKRTKPILLFPLSLNQILFLLPSKDSYHKIIFI